ncbi:MAG: DUF4175 domain-containing protein, partial [Alphaproteobacteria bacterium]|nr:DUF4175 domain-containing protein [Alphaproteobacteria bacterium]
MSQSFEPDYVEPRWRIDLARAALYWERLWPRLVPAGVLTSAFLILAMTEALSLLPLWGHGAALGGFVVALAGAVAWAVRGVTRPAPEDGRRRIELASGFRHRPLEALADRQAIGWRDPAAVTLWNAHRARMAEAASRLRLVWPRPVLARLDPWALRAIVVLAVAVALGG